MSLFFDRCWCKIDIKAFDIGFDIVFQAQPRVFPANRLFSFFNSKMIYKNIVMIFTDQLKTDNH